MKNLRYIAISLASTVLLLLSANGVKAQERPDTISVSSIYSTLILFPTDIIYADLSNKKDIEGFVVEASKDLITLQAKWPFKSTCNITAMESSGTLHTYILKYEMYPRTLIVDEKHEVYDSRPEAIDLSADYTTHMVYSSDLLYVHISNNNTVDAMIVPQARNMLAIKAKKPFGPSPAETFNVSVLESSGYLHTYIANYEQHPQNLVLNYQTGERAAESGQKQVVSLLRKTDAPQLADVLEYPQGLFHIATRKDKINLVCENIFSYSDITYVTLRIENHSGVSFEAGRTAFVRRSKPKRKNTIIEEEALIPKASQGSLSVAPGGSSKITYTFDKITLASDQVFRICVYEDNGRREFFLNLSPKDINEAKNPLEK